MDFISRFLVKTVRQGDCLVWTAAKDRDGYGLVTLKASRRKTSIGAHRLAWELANARQVPEGLYVLHICDNPSCVEPTHLYVGSQIDNMIDAVARGKRATGIDNYNGKKTHCPSGHEYSPDNILLFNGRWRRCRTCNKIRQRDKKGGRVMILDVLTLVAPSSQFMATSYLAPVSAAAGTNPTITWLGPVTDDGTQDLVYIKGLSGEPWDYLVATQSWIRQRLTERVWSNPATGKLTYGLGVRRLPRQIIYTPGCQFSFSWTMQPPETDYVIYDPPLPGTSQPVLSHNSNGQVRCTFRGPYPGAAISNSQGNMLLPAGEDWIEEYEWAGKGSPVIYGSLERVTHRKGYGRYMWQLFASDGAGGYGTTPTSQSQQCVITPLPNGVVIPKQGIF